MTARGSGVNVTGRRAHSFSGGRNRTIAEGALSPPQTHRARLLRAFEPSRCQPRFPGAGTALDSGRDEYQRAGEAVRAPTAWLVQLY